MKKYEKKLFIFIVGLILLGGFLNPVIDPDDFNYSENRYAYKLPKINIKKILNKTFQDEFEKALADQIPLSSKMKIIEKTSSILLKKFVHNIYNKPNVYLGEDIYFREDYLLYNILNIDELKSDLERKANNFNKYVNDLENIDFYIYYIELDNDINFDKNEKLGAYEYLKTKISENIKTKKFEVNNFEEFKNYFYKTDHHWNYKGAYKAYLDLIDLFQIREKVNIKKEICTGKEWSGSKSTKIGANFLFNEEFCGYEFELPMHLTFINNNLVDSYGQYRDIINGNINDISYGNYYGWDNGVVKFDYQNENKDNLLMIGDSYDNAITEMFASHFNETYNIDLRAYEMDLNKKFDIKEFIDKNKIDKVLLIGHIEYFTKDTFMLS